MNCVPIESVVGFCDHALGYSTEKPFEVHVLPHELKPASGVGVGVSVGEGDGVGDGAAVGLGLGTVVGVGILVAVAFGWESCALLEVLVRKRKVAPKTNIAISANVIQMEIMISVRLLRFCGGGGVNPGGIP